MLLWLVAIFVVGAVGEFCSPIDPIGTSWDFAMADGVRDFAYTGAATNPNYFCFNACNNSGTVVQNFKVLKAPRHLPTIGPSKKIEMIRHATKFLGNPDDYDNNKITCINDTLRKNVEDALKKVVIPTATGIARTLQYNIPMPGWVYTVISSLGMMEDAFLENDNFCLYTTVDVEGRMWDIRLLALDFSS